MRQSEYDENLILGYVENTLNADEKAIIEQLLIDDPQLAELVSMLRQDRLLLCEMDQVTAPMELGEYVSSQLERELLLGPLPYKKKVNHPDHSTPQSRGQFRIMRFCAYGSLAAMFLVVVGLMYHDTANQTLMDRVAQSDFDFKTPREREPVVAMNEPSDDTLDIDKLAASPILPSAQADVAPMAARLKKTPTETKVPMLAFIEREDSDRQEGTTPTTMADAELAKPDAETAITGNKLRALTDHMTTSNDLLAMSPTTAMLADETLSSPDASSATIDSLTLKQPESIPADQFAFKEETLRQSKITSNLSHKSDKAKGMLDTPPQPQMMRARKTPPPNVAVATKPPMPNASTINSPLAGIASSRALTAVGPRQTKRYSKNVSNTQNLGQQNAVCLIQSPTPDQTVLQINQWAISNRVEIVPEKLPTTQQKDQAQQLRRHLSAGKLVS